jgi:hypothetical protein
MKSLKSLLPCMSRLTGLSEVALYERQRALVRLGLLPAPTKTGRNSGGAMATPGSVAVLLVSIMVTDRLSEVDERVLEFLQFRTFSYPMVGTLGRPKEDCCYVTGQRTLYGALRAAIRQRTWLTDPSRIEIEIERGARVARVIGSDAQGESITEFSEGPRSDYYGMPDVYMSHVVRFAAIDQLHYEMSFDEESGDYVEI